MRQKDRLPRAVTDKRAKREKRRKEKRKAHEQRVLNLNRGRFR